jgi:hypothetical protein
MLVNIIGWVRIESNAEILLQVGKQISLEGNIENIEYMNISQNQKQNL